MAVKTFYIVGGSTSNGFQQLQDAGSAPADAAFATPTGWAVGANPVGDQSEFRPNTEQVNTTFVVQTVPTALLTGATTNAFRTPSSLLGLTGTFTTVDFSTVFRSITAAMAVGQQVRLRWRVYASTQADGTSNRELTSGVITTTTVAGTGDTTTNMSPTTATWSPGTITLSNEYMFFACAMEVMAASGTGGTRDANFRENTNSKIVIQDFTPPGTPSLLVPTDIRTRTLIRR